MPYLGQDWRSPGEEWVRTKEGWERLKLWRVKVFENLNSHCLARLLRLALEEWDNDYSNTHNVHQPYIRYIRATSKEQKVLTSISEAFVHLDLSTAGKDLRRFNYVCKLLKLLLKDKLAFLSGTAQKYVFNILEEMVHDVCKTGNNLAEMRCLLNFAARCLTERRTDHIGSSHLWNSHWQSINKMAAKLRKHKLKEREDDGRPTFSDLPHDCVRSILSTIPDHGDLLRVGQTNSTNHHLSNEMLLWKQMCFFHFSKRQLLTFLNQNEDESQTNWKMVYQRCYMRFGKKDTYADMLAICSHCKNIFWQSIGHPCIHNLPPKCQTLKPEQFIALFQF